MGVQFRGNRSWKGVALGESANICRRILAEFFDVPIRSFIGENTHFLHFLVDVVRLVQAWTKHCKGNAWAKGHARRQNGNLFDEFC